MKCRIIHDNWYLLPSLSHALSFARTHTHFWRTPLGEPKRPPGQIRSLVGNISEIKRLSWLSISKNFHRFSKFWNFFVCFDRLFSKFFYWLNLYLMSEKPKHSFAPSPSPEIKVPSLGSCTGRKASGVESFVLWRGGGCSKIKHFSGLAKKAKTFSSLRSGVNKRKILWNFTNFVNFVSGISQGTLFIKVLNSF